MKVADYISNFLHAQGVTCVFEVVGGMITHLIDSMYRHNKMQIISMKNSANDSKQINWLSFKRRHEESSKPL